LITGSALRNWTQGNWVNGTKNPAGQPSIYGANFQAITFAQQNYGYLDGVGTPSPELAATFDVADSRLGTFLDDLANARVQHSTLVLIGSKQGQGPIDPKTLVVTDPQTVIDGAGVPVAFFTHQKPIPQPSGFLRHDNLKLHQKLQTLAQ
jgi:hypothetical protein